MQITAYNLIEEKLAGIILKKMTTALDYTRDPEGNSDIIIPVGDIYNAFFANEILDIDHFATSEAQATEQAVYAAYSERLDSAINEIIAELQSSSSKPYKDLSKEMQAYMIAEREQNRPAAVEEERVMEAISARREKRKAEAAADAARGITASRASASNTASGRKTVLSRLGALKAAAPTLNAASRKTAFGTAYQARLGSTGALFPKLCRIGCLVLLLVLVGTALTSVNQYPDMKAVSALLAGAVRNTKNETENTSPGLIVEETVGWNSSDEMAQSAALDEATQADDATGAANTAMDDEVTDNRTAGNVMTDNVTADSATADSATADSQNAVATDADAAASDSFPQVQEALAHPESYQVQKGDSLIAISRRFYGTDEKVIEICRLNNIKDPNQIQPGQNILLPSK